MATEIETATRADGLMSAGAPGWYSLVAVSFFFCEFNPIAAAGVAMGLKNAYATPFGWVLTASSFMLALAGFAIAGRTAYRDRNRRALEIAGIITIAAGLIPFIVGIAIPSIIMWPISALFIMTGVSAMRACMHLPHPTQVGGVANEATANIEATATAAPSRTGASQTADTSVAGGGVRKRRRRRRRRHSRGSAQPREGGGPVQPE